MQRAVSMLFQMNTPLQVSSYRWDLMKEIISVDTENEILNIEFDGFIIGDT